MRRLLLFLLCLLIMFDICQSSDHQYNITAEPDWIRTNEPNYEAKVATDSASGYYYLLVDKQENLIEQCYYVHYAIKILNADGLQETSSLEIEFDPDYQILSYHKVNLVRNNRVINQLDTSTIQLFQRESGLSSHIYDGNLTAVIEFVDAQIGDIIEYSYSVHGENPIYAGHYSGISYLQYSLPVEYLYRRLVSPARRELHFKYYNDAAHPKISNIGPAKTYEWEESKLAALLYDINTPSWYNPYRHMEISDFGSWADVVDWGRKLFEIDEAEERLLREQYQDLIENSTIDSSIVTAIRFVQDDIRYLGNSSGIYSHKPHTPSEVLSKRYGDCKDKSFLLCEILKTRGLNASPVLVDTHDGYALGECLPSTGIFNHCIVCLEKDGKTYFIDPTIADQGGDLDHIYTPNYYHGLILKEGETTLTALPVSDYSKIRISETLKLKEVDGSATFNVTSTYTGREADDIRDNLAGTDLPSMGKSYVEFYSAQYPYIRSSGDIKVRDNRENLNEIVIDEFYEIDSLWYVSEDDSNVINCEIYPLSFVNYVRVKKSPKRTMPYYVKFPENVEHESIVILPEDWTIYDDSSSTESDCFSYNYRVSFNPDTIRIVHTYKTNCSFVNADGTPSFIKEHDQIIDNLSYILYYNKNQVSGNFRICWPIMAYILGLLILGYMVAYRIYKNYDIEVPPLAEEPRKIGGWLILVGLGFMLRPIFLFYDIASTSEYYNSVVWNALFNFDQSLRYLLLGMAMLAELAINTFIFIYSTLIIALFNNRRTILPRAAIVFLALNPIVIIVDTIVVASLGVSNYSDAEIGRLTKDITTGVVAALVWIPYFIVSKRVKQTFVLKYQDTRR